MHIVSYLEVSVSEMKVNRIDTLLLSHDVTLSCTVSDHSDKGDIECLTNISFKRNRAILVQFIVLFSLHLIGNSVVEYTTALV